MDEAVPSPGLVRFGTFEVDLRAGEVRKAGVRLNLTGQPFQVLAILLGRPGQVVSRDELQKRLWPDTFVDVDHNLNTAINRIREVLGDSAESPRFVETLSRRGYRFIAPVDGAGNGVNPATITRAETAAPRRWWILGAALRFGALTLLAGIGFLVYKGRRVPAAPRQRTLTRVTFGDGLQIERRGRPMGASLPTAPIAAGNSTSGLWGREVGIWHFPRSASLQLPKVSHSTIHFSGLPSEIRSDSLLLSVA